MTDTVSFDVPSPGGPRTVTVSYRRQGAGEPLLLLHGIGHHLQAWDPVSRILAAEREVIAVDLPGFGASPALPEGLEYDLPTVTTVLGGLCEALGVERPHVAGNSLGGLLALTTRHLWVVTTGVVLLGGAAVWLLGAPRTVVIGASGVVYGYAAFLVVYGFVVRRVGPALVGLLVVMIYGGLLWGVLPLRPGVSWQGHLFGAVAGVALALWLGRRDRGDRRSARR